MGNNPHGETGVVLMATEAWRAANAGEPAPAVVYGIARRAYEMGSSDSPAGGAPSVPPQQVTEALQGAWNDFVADEGCYPDCFEIRMEGGKPVLYADFRRGNFATWVARSLGAP